jgi:hypothetical protein
MSDLEETEKYKENIIRKMIENIILPKYSDVKGIRKLYSDFHRGVRRYTVVLDMEKILGNSDDIVREIETLFKMASLNTESNSGARDYIRVFREMND